MEVPAYKDYPFVEAELSRPNGMALLPYGSLRITAPCRVTITVCSNWAVHPPSTVRTVHPSTSTLTSGDFSTRIGSMVITSPSGITGPVLGRPTLGTSG